MGLILWLPMTGDLHNQGLDDSYTFTIGSATIDNNGKIGKCYNFSSTSSNGINLSTGNVTTFMNTYINNHSWSICAWIKNSINNGNTCVASFSYGLSLFSGSSTYITLCNRSRTVTCYSSVGTGDNKWHHIAATYNVDNNNIKIYVDGINTGNATYTSGYTYASSWNNGIFIGRDPNNNTANAHYFYQGQINDFRLYDEALSPREIKEISKGKILHYPLNDNQSVMNNCYANPTFISNVSGWNHWGRSGHAGTSGQSTDRNYIFRSNQTYSHWVANASTATREYLLYQSPAFEGGYRSLQCICKEENGTKITEDVCFPDWNNRNGGVPGNLWTSIIPLDNGFYWCKCEGLSQDGNNDLVGIFVCPGYKVYFSEAYLENDKLLCSNPFFDYDGIVYDTSGFCNNGELYTTDGTGEFIWESGSPRYDIACNIHSLNSTTNAKAGTAYIRGDCELTTPQQLTVAFWCYARTDGYGGQIGQGMFCTTNQDGDNIGTDYQTSGMNHRDNNINVNPSSGSQILLPITFIANQWHHYAFTYDGQYARAYRDGVLFSTKNFSSAITLGTFKHVVIGFSKAGGVWRRNNNSYSDFRVYATALDDDSIEELYNTPITLSNSGSLLTQGEYVEV